MEMLRDILPTILENPMICTILEDWYHESMSTHIICPCSGLFMVPIVFITKNNGDVIEIKTQTVDYVGEFPSVIRGGFGPMEW